MAAAAEKNDELPLSSMIKSPKKPGPKPKPKTADATVAPPKKKVAQSGPKKSGKKVRVPSRRVGAIDDLTRAAAAKKGGGAQCKELF